MVQTSLFLNLLLWVLDKGEPKKFPKYFNASDYRWKGVMNGIDRSA